MNDVELKAVLGRYSSRVSDYLSGCLREGGVPDKLLESMEYSLLAGGKRLRPVLCVVWAEMLGLSLDAALPFASGLELIHTYSLIHDDLPAMDDDDLRRGRPSNHKVYGEAMGILAGDGLLTRAFGLMAGDHAGADAVPADRRLAATAEVARGAGPAGMVGGQVIDMEQTGKSADLDGMRLMHSMKTGALITVACVSGALLAGAGRAEVDQAREYGRNTGLAFQIVDDILDVVGDTATLGKPAGSDQESGKCTYPALLGLDESRRLALEAVERALAAIAGFSGPQADFLRGLARYIVDRAH